jgi:peptidoglycan LD-endopeptidase CwlK
MKDKISISRIQLLHPSLREEVRILLDKAEAIISPELVIRIVQGLRTIEEQNAIYAQGRTKPGKKVTNARGGSSYHNYGLAIDFAFLDSKGQISWDINKDWDLDHQSDWMEVVKIFKEAGWEYGGDWKMRDYPHLQKSFGYSWQQLLEKYNKKDFIKDTKYVNI